MPAVENLSQSLRNSFASVCKNVFVHLFNRPVYLYIFLEEETA